MSLINKMLQDLEARQDSPGDAKPVYQDLRSVKQTRSGSAARLLVMVIGVCTVGVAVYFGAGFLGINLREMPATPANTIVQAPVPVAEVAPAPVAPIAAVTPAPAFTPASVTPESIAPAPRKAFSKEKSVATAQAPREAAPNPVSAEAAPKPPSVTAAKARSEAVASVPDQVAVVDKKVRPVTPEAKAEAAYHQAVKLLEQGRPDEALYQLREALVAQPANLKVRELAAGISLQTGHAHEAQRLLEEGLQQVPSNHVFALLLARVHMERGAESKAVVVMESAAPQVSDNADFSSFLGTLYQRAGRHADALKAYERAITLRPTDGRTWLGFAISLEGTQQRSAAVEAYQRARESGGLTQPLARYAEQRILALKDR